MKLKEKQKIKITIRYSLKCLRSLDALKLIENTKINKIITGARNLMYGNIP
jgi:hypothetical protein